MFNQAKKKVDSDAKGLAKKSSRGNMDEYEALRTVVSENPGLLLRVLEKIRVYRALSAPPTGNPDLKKDEKPQKKEPKDP